MLPPPLDPPPTPLPPTSRSPTHTRVPTLRNFTTNATLAEIVETLRKIGEKCALGCPECRAIAGLPEREYAPAEAPRRQPHRHEDETKHRRNCPGVEAWSLLARLLG